MVKEKGVIIYFCCFFIFISKSLSQVDTAGLSRSISYYEIELKENWDNHFSQGGIWTDLLTNKRYALDCKHIFLFEYFVRLNKANIDDLIDDNYSILAQGCECGSEYLVNKGIQQHVNLSLRYGQDYMTALMLSIKSGNLNNSKILLSHVDSINLLNTSFQNELQLSIEYLRDTQFVGKLLARNADVLTRSTSGLNALEVAYYFGGINMFNYLFEYHLNKFDAIYWQSSELVEMSIIGGDTSALQKFLMLCDPNKDKNQNIQYLDAAIEFAVHYNLTNKYRCEYTGDTTIGSYATKDLDIAIFRTLIKHNNIINELDSTGENILFKCINLPEIATFLIQNNINLNQINQSGKTFLDNFINEIINPPLIDLSGMSDYKPMDRDYSKELSALLFYTEHGAYVGSEKANGWKYILEKAKLTNNSFLLKYLNEKYSAYIKKKKIDKMCHPHLSTSQRFISLERTL